MKSADLTTTKHPKKHISINGLSAVIMLLTGAIFLFQSCNSNAPLRKTDRQFLLDTVCTLTLPEGTKDTVFSEVFSHIKKIETRMSAHSEESEVTAISRSGTKGAIVSKDTFQVIQEGLTLSEKSNGLYDITIAPLVNVWGIGTEQQKVPTEKEIKSILPLIDYKKVQLDKSTHRVTLENPNMKIDLGGIAKGYAADEAARILKMRGIKRAIINFGGNIYMLGEKTSGDLWRIGIQNPDDTPGTYIGILKSKETAVVTSGTYERYFIKDGKKYHHIFDPRTGYPVRNSLLSVSIITEKAIQADGMSTTIFLLGLEKGMQYVEQAKGMEAIFVTKDRTIYPSSGIKDRFAVTNENYRLNKEE